MCHKRFDITVGVHNNLEFIPNVPFNYQHFAFYGTQDHQYSYVRYKVPYITIFEKREGKIGLSDNFSGCYMAQFTYKDTTYIAHIFTDVKEEKDKSGHPIKVPTILDTRIHWNNFINDIVNTQDENFHDFILFKPYEPNLHEMLTNNIGYVGKVNIIGIIDTHNVCYSAILDKDGGIARIFDRHDAARVPGVLTNANKQELIIPQPSNRPNE